MDRDRVLLGSVDDAIGRNPWPGAPATLQELNALLIFYALIGPRPEIAFGNIAYNPAFRAALIGPDGAIGTQASPLIRLAASGLISLYRRSDTLWSSVQSRADQDHAHARDFLQTTHPAQLDYLQSLFGQGLRQQEPSDAQFAALLHKSYPLAPKGFQITADRAMDLAERSGKALSRSTFEKVLKQNDRANDLGDAAQSILQMATALKHFAHAKNMGVSVETRLFRLAAPLIAQDLTNRGQITGLAELDRRLRATKTRILQDIRIPADLLTDARLWDRFRPDGPELHDFLTAKAGLRACVTLDIFSAAQDLDQLHRRGRAAVQDYNAALERLIGRSTLSRAAYLSFRTIPVAGAAALEYAGNLASLPAISATLLGLTLSGAGDYVLKSRLVSRVMVRLHGGRQDGVAKPVGPTRFRAIAMPVIALPA